MKTKIILTIVVILSIALGCKKESVKEDKIVSNKKITVGLALGVGGLGDQSFNDMQYNGLIELSKNFDVNLFYEAPVDDSEEEMYKILDKLCSVEKCDFVIAGAGYLMINPLDKISDKYKDTKFVLIDDYAVLKDNVSSIVFAQEEGSFVVGSLAAYFSKTKKVGFIGAVDMQIIKSFLDGFKKGIVYADNTVNIIEEYISFEKDNDYSGYDNPKKAYEIAKKLYDSGCDVIYSVAGASGNGIIQCAADMKKYVIGVDSNQDFMAKGYVLTSMMKRLDKAVYDITENFIAGKFMGNKIYLYSYNNGGISITDMKYTETLIGENVVKKIRNIETKISKGEIIVKD